MMTYYENTLTANEYISNAYNLEARSRAIAANAVLEQLKAIGRADRPMTDHDAATMENIYACLRNLVGEGQLQRTYEHNNLAIANTAPTAAQAKIADLLDNVDLAEDEPERVVAEAPPAKVSLPKSTVPKSTR